MSLERYRDVVPDWDDFVEHAGRAEPTAFRVRSGRASAGAVVDRLEEQGFGVEPIDAVPHFFRVVDGPRPVSQTLEHWLGLLYVQQASTGLAAPALGPAPGERVLDMCAAPGGKTSHAAELMDDRGCLVAADVSDGRLPGLLGNLYRLRHTCAVCVRADGRSFPGGAQFDRVLVDAPCSAEGNLRRKGGELPEQPDDFKEHVVALQKGLLRRAVELTRPGGVVLYATCTFAPEENEAVVDRILSDAPVSVEPIDGLDAPHDPGLTEFEGESFAPELERAWRVYPHHLDSGGLFMARLRKAGEGEARDGGWTQVPAAHPDDPEPGEAPGRVEAGRQRLADRFGVPEERLDRANWLVRGHSVWAHTCREWPIDAWSSDGRWRYVCAGLRALKRDPRFGERSTNDAVRWLEEDLADRVVEVDAPELRRLLEGERLEGDRLRGADLAPGIVALRLGDDVVGRGVVDDAGLRHEIPKARAGRLREILERSADTDRGAST